MESNTEYLIEYLHTSTNNIYSINYVIDENLFSQFQNSEKPEELGFTFERIYVYVDPELYVDPIPLEPS